MIHLSQRKDREEWKGDKERKEYNEDQEEENTLCPHDEPEKKGRERREGKNKMRMKK